MEDDINCIEIHSYTSLIIAINYIIINKLNLLSSKFNLLLISVPKIV